MTSKTSIVNIALSRIGANLQLANVDTETNRAAITARLAFDNDVDFVLRDFPWPWATAYATLALVDGSDTEAANNDWQYAYRYPTDCVYGRRLVVATLGLENPSPPPFKMGRDSQGRLIFTDEPDAELEYTQRIADPEEFDPMFVSMLAWKIAAGLAPSLSRIEKMAEKCMAQYTYEKSMAEATSLNEAQQSQPLESEMIRARD